MSIRALVVDDEPLGRRAIRRFVGKHVGVDVIGECGDGESAVRAIRERKPDLVFLDVQMPEMDGFQVLSEVGANEMPVTIFVTAYDRYALRAFDANAIDYLLKPIGKERFERALTRAKHRIAGQFNATRCTGSYPAWSGLPQREYTRTGCRFPRTDEYCSSRRKTSTGSKPKATTYVFTSAIVSYEFRETLAALEEKLNPSEFLRIHRSTIVNIHRIKEIQAWFHGHHRVLLENGTELRMSRYQREIARKLGLA